MYNIYRAKRFFHKKKKKWSGYYSDTLWLPIVKSYNSRVKSSGGVVEHLICVNNIISNL